MTYLGRHSELLQEVGKESVHDVLEFVVNTGVSEGVLVFLAEDVAVLVDEGHDGVEVHRGLRGTMVGWGGGGGGGKDGRGREINNANEFVRI